MSGTPPPPPRRILRRKQLGVAPTSASATNPPTSVQASGRAPVTTPSSSTPAAPPAAAVPVAGAAKSKTLPPSTPASPNAPAGLHSEGSQATGSTSPAPGSGSPQPGPLSPMQVSAAASWRTDLPAVAIDRTVFSSITFSSAAFVNNIAKRILFPAMQRHKQNTKRGGGQSPGPELRGSDGAVLFSSPKLPARARQAEGVDLPPEAYAAIAGQLTYTLEQAADEIGRLLTAEEEWLQSQEVRCRRVEIREKKQLAKIRLGLEATTGRLHEYESRVSNAQTAMAGIEQHLSQANTRVQRGRSVFQLLGFFKMFTSISQKDLESSLKALSKARVVQRTVITDRWKTGKVSPYNPRYYTTPTGSGEATTTTAALSPTGDATAPAADDDMTPSTTVRREVGGGGRHRNDDDDDEAISSGDDDDGSDDGKDPIFTHFKLHRAESAAVAAGLDRLFAARACTETQVEWCQKIQLLVAELAGVVGNTENVNAYVVWLRKEIVADLFHVIGCFSAFYDENPQTAAHVSYGRALLKTMELISRLYTTLTPTVDALLSVFFSRSVNDLGVTLFSEHCPQPLPSQPPLPNPHTVLAMEHFTRHTERELRAAFAFLLSRLTRDVIVVEMVFGMTSTARQQLLMQVTEGVLKPFITQQIKLAETHENAMTNGEANLSPRSKRRCGVRVADGMAYHQSVQACLFTCFENFLSELRRQFSTEEVEVVSRLTDVIFSSREGFSKSRAAVELLSRYYTIIEDKYTRSLHPATDGGFFFDLREAHMTKAREIMNALMEVAGRVRAYALPTDVGLCMVALIKVALKYLGTYLEEELRKTFESVRSDRDNWKVKPKSEDELLRPPKPEPQQSGFRMLLFAQSSLMSFSEGVTTICIPLLNIYPRLLNEVDEARTTSLEALDERAEKLLNLCVQVVVVRSLAILIHYQGKNDYMPKDHDLGAVAPPCTRACTLFCYYITRQLEETKEFIRLSNGQVSGWQRQQLQQQRPVASEILQEASATLGASAFSVAMIGGGTSDGGGGSGGGAAYEAARARARMMNFQQLLYGDGGPSSFVRTLGVCLYRGITAHLKSFTANDRGALVYKQDVTAYREAMIPLSTSPGIGGAVVEVLFQMLKETSSLLIMPLDHIKEVKNSGVLRLMPGGETARFIRIRLDVREAFKSIGK